jgi:hypothetical protein
MRAELKAKAPGRSGLRGARDRVLEEGHNPQTIGDGDARSSLPRGAGGHDPVGDGTGRSVLASTKASSSDDGAPSYASTSYEGGGAVPERVVIEVTVQARPV